MPRPGEVWSRIYNGRPVRFEVLEVKGAQTRVRSLTAKTSKPDWVNTVWLVGKHEKEPSGD